MADKKISQLTGASTPLAGTEVLPIVQSGSTVKVSIDDVTKGRTVNATTFDTDVAAAGVTLSGTTLSADGTNTNISINITPKGTGDLLTTKAHVSGTFSKNTGDENTWGVRITDLTAQAAGVGGGLVLVGNYTDGGAKAAFAAIAGAKVNGTTGNNLGDLKIYSSDVAGLLQERGSFKSTGDLAINNGNLVIGTAGKGIDFSADAHAAGMTSELLDDYEEGTWTPEYEGLAGSAGALAYSVQRGRYTKVGRMVFATAEINLSNKGSWTSGVRITGLPFTSSGATEIAMGSVILGFVDFAAGQLYAALRGTGANGTAFYIDMISDNADRAILDASAVANNSTFWFNLIYTAQ